MKVKMVRRNLHEVSGEIITQSMVLGVLQYISMVLKKCDNGTWFSLARVIYPWYWRLLSIKGGKGEWKRNTFGWEAQCYLFLCDAPLDNS